MGIARLRMFNSLEDLRRSVPVEKDIFVFQLSEEDERVLEELRRIFGRNKLAKEFSAWVRERLAKELPFILLKPSKQRRRGHTVQMMLPYDVACAIYTYAVLRGTFFSNALGELLKMFLEDVKRRRAKGS